MARPRAVTRAERGQTSAEYVGVLAFVAAVVALVIAAGPSIGGSVVDGIERAICTVTGGDCGQGAEIAQPGAPEDGDSAVDPGGGGDSGGGDPEDPEAEDSPVDQAVVDAAVDDVRDELDGGFWGVRSGDLDEIEETLAGLTGAELDAVIASLSDDELDHLFDELDDGWFGSGWDAERRREFLNMLASKASPETIERLNEFTDELQPAFDEVGGDDAADDPDSPAASAEYGEVPHELFIDGDNDGESIHPNDVDQGAIGDCWIMAAMTSVAQENPQIIEDMIRRNENGTYTVTFHDGDEEVEITVTADVPLNEDGEPVFAEFPHAGVDRDGADYELWPAIIEKAYARYSGDYHEIEGGRAEDALEAMTGVESESHDMDDLSIGELADIHDAGGAITMSSLDDADETDFYSDGLLVTGHAYYVSDIDEEAGTITIRNPWGYHIDPLTLTLDEYRENFDRIGTNSLGGD
jgi:hypothetical protein